MKKFLNIKNIIIVVVIIGAIFLVRQQISAAKDQTTKYNPKKQTLYTPQIQDIKETLTITSSINTDQIANLRFQNSGKLNWVGVKVGDTVRRGQAIASLDRNELKKNLQTQFNNYRTQLSKFTDDQYTYINTVDRNSLPDTIKRILNRTQYSLDNSVITYEIADMAIKESVLVTPISGVVVNIDQPLSGTNVTPATATFTIINPDSLYLKGEIDQEMVTKVFKDQSVTIKLDSYPELNIESKVTYIAFTPITGQTSTVYEIRFELPLKNENLKYRLGMDGDVQIVLAEAKDALTIPSDAINFNNEEQYVYVKSGNELVRKNIKIGIENDTVTQVIEGLTVNDQVVIVQK
jgi:RND family efflux transporter MFP subunit